MDDLRKKRGGKNQAKEQLKNSLTELFRRKHKDHQKLRGRVSADKFCSITFLSDNKKENK
jgi:hypothetical protein